MDTFSGCKKKKKRLAVIFKFFFQCLKYIIPCPLGLDSFCCHVCSYSDVIALLNTTKYLYNKVLCWSHRLSGCRISLSAIELAWSWSLLCWETSLLISLLIVDQWRLFTSSWFHCGSNVSPPRLLNALKTTFELAPKELMGPTSSTVFPVLFVSPCFLAS